MFFVFYFNIPVDFLNRLDLGGRFGKVPSTVMLSERTSLLMTLTNLTVIESSSLRFILILSNSTLLGVFLRLLSATMSANNV